MGIKGNTCRDNPNLDIASTCPVPVSTAQQPLGVTPDDYNGKACPPTCSVWINEVSTKAYIFFLTKCSLFMETKLKPPFVLLKTGLQRVHMQ